MSDVRDQKSESLHICHLLFSVYAWVVSVDL
jgi:hypothetical protein